MPGSSDSINYALRPNKSVERKLIIEALTLFQPPFDFSGYRYIGMGAMWFVDFQLVHRHLRLEDMFSLEMDNHRRAHFNRPYSCIRVIEGESTALLNEGILPIEDKPLLIWFDYDGMLNESVLRDLEHICWKARPGTVFLVTVNANKGFYRGLSEMGTKLPVEDSLRQSFGELVPNPFPADADTRVGFPKLLTQMLGDHVTRVLLKSRANLEFVRLFDFSYEDGSPMATFGVMLADDMVKRMLDSSPAFRLDFVAPKTQYRIDVPPLTIREKVALDQMMPAMQAPFAPVVESELSFSISELQLANYKRFYRHYPLYWEALGS